jgi:ACS family D-galactonate transporter-like MFS transporter
MQNDLPTVTPAPTVPAARRTRKRAVVLALISIGTMINYLDRAVLGVAAPGIVEEFAFNAAAMGILFSAFSWTYAAAQIPGGVLLDRMGTKLTYFWSVSLWSACIVLHGLATGFYTFLVARLGLGVTEAPCFPANSRVLATWFPQHERARANSAFSVGQYFGLAFLTPLLFWIVATFGWRVLFIAAGLLGLLFAVVWMRMYREPGQHPTVNQAELAYITAGGGVSAPARPMPFSWVSMGILIRKRQILGASIGQFAGNSTLVFFLTWFPTYLATERQMEWLKVGIFAIAPYIAASVGVVVGGFLSDRLLAKTGSANLGRKLPIILGLLLASTIILANYVESNVLVIAIMSVAFFGQGMVNLGWTLITDVAPKQLIGLTGGIFNLCANLAGIATPMVIGFVVGATGSFFGGLAYIAVVALIGVFSYVFILGDVRRIELSPDELAIISRETNR